MQKNAAHIVMVFSILLCSLSSASQEHITVPHGDGSQNTIVIVKEINSENYPFRLPQKGPMIVEDLSNQLLFSTFLKNHLLHGSWKSYYNPQQLIDSGKLVKGLPTGLWKTWYANGQLKSVRNYDADLYFRMRADVDLNHPRISRFALTERYKQEGTKVLQMLSANYSFHIQQKTITPDLTLLVTQNQQQPFNYHPPFKNVLHHGLYMNYYENGAVQDSGYYKEGLRNGLWVHHQANGSYWRGLYKNGIHIKEWKCYTPEGKLLMFIIYNEKGKELHRQQF